MANKKENARCGNIKGSLACKKAARNNSRLCQGCEHNKAVVVVRSSGNKSAGKASMRV